jgi:hypothetical protein
MARGVLFDRGDLVGAPLTAKLDQAAAEFNRFSKHVPFFARPPSANRDRRPKPIDRPGVS